MSFIVLFVYFHFINYKNMTTQSVLRPLHPVRWMYWMWWWPDLYACFRLRSGFSLLISVWNSAGLWFYVYTNDTALFIWGEMRDHIDRWRGNYDSRESYLLHLSLRLTFFWRHLVLLAFHPYLDCWPQDLPPQSEYSSLHLLYCPGQNSQLDEYYDNLIFNFKFTVVNLESALKMLVVVVVSINISLLNIIWNMLYHFFSWDSVANLCSIIKSDFFFFV